MKGFSGILVLFAFLIFSIILLSTTYQQKSEDNSLLIIPKIKNFTSIYELNIKNMASDCNWLKSDSEIYSCITNGSNLIFEKSKLDPMISCTRPFLGAIDMNNYYLDLNCTNKLIMPRNMVFEFQKRISIASPLQ